MKIKHITTSRYKNTSKSIIALCNDLFLYEQELLLVNQLFRKFKLTENFFAVRIR